MPPSIILLFVVLAVAVGCGERLSDGTDSSESPEIAANSPGEKSSADAKSASLAIFQKRILPIFQSTEPSSCSECHLSGVDLKDYIRPSQAETFASLVAAGLVDKQKPNKSRLLEFIRRAPAASDLVSDAVRKEELEAFQEWIRACVLEPGLVSEAEAGPIGPQIPDEVIRHSRSDRVLASFIDNVWTEVGRCAACHSPDRNQKQVAEHGEQVSWIQLNDPEKTMSYMLKSDLINIDDPSRSLLLLKPTNQIEHGGGVKMEVGDRTWQQFRRFIDDYRATVTGQYTKVKELPAPSKEVSAVSEIWLKIEGVPEEYDGMLLQADLIPWMGDNWAEHRSATSDRAVFGKGRLWQHSLSLTAQRGSVTAQELSKQQLAPGKYLIRISVDQTGKLKRNSMGQMTEDDVVAEVEVESRWPVGYGSMTTVQFPASPN